jgi:hypothetical protein
VQDAGEQIAPQLVGAEQMPLAQRRQPALGEVLSVGAGQGQYTGECYGQHDECGAYRPGPQLEAGAAPLPGRGGPGEIARSDGAGPAGADGCGHGSGRLSEAYPRVEQRIGQVDEELDEDR